MPEQPESIDEQAAEWILRLHEEGFSESLRLEFERWKQQSPQHAAAASGEKTPQQALDNLAKEQDAIMTRLERSKVLPVCGPKMNPERDAQYWFDQPGAPKPKLANEKPKGETVNYNDLLKQWEAARK